MDEKRLKVLEERCSSWSDETLIHAIKFERNDYEPPAIALMEKELLKRNIPEEQISSIQQDFIKTKGKEDMKLSGVGGWLIVFLIVVIINSLVRLFSGYTNLAFILGNPLVLRWVLIFPLSFFLLAGYGVYVFVLLVMKKKSAPRHATRWITFNFLWLVVEIIGLFWAEFLRFELSLANFIPFVANPLVIGSVFSTLIWLIYFSESKRVKLVYGEHDDNHQRQK
jgi:hypothetical protein